MNSEQFEGVFLRLGRSSRESSPSARINKFGRPSIGQFGIGFIAAVPFAETIRVETASEKCKQVHGVQIRCLEIMESSEAKDLEARQLEEKGANGAGAAKDSPQVTNEPPAEFKFPGWDRDRVEGDPRSFTSVQLENLTRLAYDSVDAQLRGGWYQPKRERKKPITRAMREAFVTNWLSRILPLGYTDPEGDKKLQDTLRGLLSPNYYPIRVTVNGRRIHRPLAEPVLVGDAFTLTGESGNWKAKGILWSPQEVISPFFLRGIPMRVSDMAIGQPSYFDLNEMGRVYGKLQHIAGEVHLQGFSDVLSLDKQSLKGSPQSDEFFPRIREKVTQFEALLQQKATVMEDVRDLKRSLDAQYPDRMKTPTLAPVLVAGERAKELIARAKRAGITVEETEGDEIFVPRGERSFTIGRHLGTDLLRIGKGKRQIRVVVEPHKAVLSDSELVRSILAEGDSLRIQGSHVLLSEDAWALGNLRMMVLLRIAVREGKLDKEQVQWLVESLRELYE
jgi:hypothetical protein